MSILSIVAGVAIAILSAGPLGPDADVERLSPIRILDHSHDVQFPDQVVFSLDAESDSPITEVQLFYRLADRNIQAYGYPEFSSDRRVSAEFRIKTGGSSYIPTGVEIEYFYRIIDAAGNTLETEHITFEYRDPRYTWSEVRRGDLVVLSHNLSLDRVERMAEDVAQRLTAVKEMFGLDDVLPIKAVIVNGRRESQRVFPYTSDTADRLHLYAGFAFGEYRVFVAQGLSLSTMMHESTHLLLDQAVSSPLAKVPAWLNEGLAMHFETGARLRAPIVEQAARSNRLIRLKNMGAVPGRPRDVSIFYSQAWSVVDYMVETYGAERMSALVSALAEGDKIDEAILRTYGFALNELEQRWKSKLLGETSLVARPDPATVGTSTLISGAVFIAIIASVWRWISRWLRGPQPVDDGA